MKRGWLSLRVVVLFILAGTLFFSAPPARAQKGRALTEFLEAAAERLAIRTPRIYAAEDGAYLLKVHPSDVPQVRKHYDLGENWNVGGGEAELRLTEQDARRLIKHQQAPFVSSRAVQALKLRGGAIVVPPVTSVDEARALQVGEGRVIVATDAAAVPHLRDAYPRELVVLQRTPFLNGLDSLDTLVTKIRVHNGLPTTDEEFFKVFGRTPSEADRSAMAEARALLPARAKGGNMSDEIRKATAAGKPGEIDAVVAHNENGVLKFPDGTTLPLEEVAPLAKSRVVLASCNSLKTTRTGQVLMGTGKPLKLVEGAKAGAAIKESEAHPGTMREFIIKVGIGIASLVGVSGVPIWVFDHDEGGT